MDINQQTKDTKRTLLMEAVFFDIYENFEILINNPKINLEIQDYAGNTALHIAVNIFLKTNIEIYFQMAQKILEKKNNGTNIRNNLGQTPLILGAQGMLAVKEESLEYRGDPTKTGLKITELLLTCEELNLNITDNFNYNALDRAFLAGNKNIYLLLKAHGAEHSFKFKNKFLFN